MADSPAFLYCPLLRRLDGLTWGLTGDCIVSYRVSELRYRLSSIVSTAGSLFFLLASHMAVQRAVMTATMMSAR